MFCPAVTLTLAALTAFNFAKQANCKAADQYVAAVYEKASNFSVPNRYTKTRQEALNIMHGNLQLFKEQATIASQKVLST